jgi:16S rRNA (guanine966-N2)-methyltransferase
VRVVGGEARGRSLQAPSGRATRPTGDRVREAIFNILGSLMDLRGARVADLFAGSGALGIEALSRGAGHVVLVDNDPSALAVVRANLESLGYGSGESASVVRADVLPWAQALVAERFDVVLADPPYGWDRWRPLLEALVPRAGLVVAETGKTLDLGDQWSLVRDRRYGATVVTVARPENPGPTKQLPVELKGRR